MTVTVKPRPGRPGSATPPGGAAPRPVRPGARRGRRRSAGSPRGRKAAFLAAAAAAVLVAAAVLGYRFVSEDVLGPKAKVEDYLAALASGDHSAAHSLLPAVEALVPREEAVYREAGHRITGFSILGQEIRDGRAVVQVAVVQNGETKPVEFRLRDTGIRAGIFTVWQLEPTAARTVQVDVPAGTETIRINGAELALPPGTSHAEVLLLPGSYLIQGPPQRYLSYGPGQTVTVEPGMAGDPDGVRLRPAVTGELAPEVQLQAEAYLSDCLSGHEAAPAACPNAAYTAFGPERYRNLEWSLEKAPQYRIVGTPETGLAVYATGGKARAVYQEDVSGAGRWENRTDLVNISFGSELELAGDTPGLDFRP